MTGFKAGTRDVLSQMTSNLDREVTWLTLAQLSRANQKIKKELWTRVMAYCNQFREFELLLPTAFFASGRIVTSKRDDVLKVLCLLHASSHLPL